MRRFTLTPGTAKPEWLAVPIPRYAHLYEVSSAGQVRALDRFVVDKLTGIKRSHKGRIITPKQSGRYLGVSLFDHPDSTRFYIHRLVALAFIPNPDNKPCVNHKNRDRYDNRVENLEWVTYQENSQHLISSVDYVPPRAVKGEDSPSAKLNAEVVEQLRLSWEPGAPIGSLARLYGVSHRAIYQALSGNTWKHVAPKRAVNWPH